MTTKPVGYSGSALPKKLGIGPATHVYLMDAPIDYKTWLVPLPEGVAFDKTLSEATDVIHLFAMQRATLEKQLQLLRKQIRSDAAVWVSWPKKSAKLPTDITEDVIRAVALPMGWVDIKVCAVSEVWSGLKLVIRKALR